MEWSNKDSTRRKTLQMTQVTKLKYLSKYVFAYKD